jgi:uncharacterized damage-inducible protein DinB
MQMLNESARAVWDAVESPANLHYDHPILLLQHMLWHESYHHGQIKLTLKITAAQSQMTMPVRSRGACGCAKLSADERQKHA